MRDALNDMMRHIVQFHSNEALARYIDGLNEKSGLAGIEARPSIRVVHQLVMSPILVLDTHGHDDLVQDNEAEGHDHIQPHPHPGLEDTVAIEHECPFFLAGSGASTVLAMPTIHHSIYGPFHADGITIAVIDGGIDATQLDLKHISIIKKSFLDLHAGVAQDHATDLGHGTAIAGIICGSGQNAKGKYCGIVMNPILLDCTALDASGKGLLGDIMAAIDHAACIGSRIICMPFSALPREKPSPLFEQFLSSLVNSRGVVLCGGAGNLGPEQGTIGMPGCFDCVLTTGSTSPTFNISRFSGRGSLKLRKPDFCLPGEQVVSINVMQSFWKDRVLDENEYYGEFSGNSVSVGMLAGIVALILSATPGITPREVKKVLVQSCSRIRKFASFSTGYGVLSPAKALRNLNQLHAFQSDLPTIVRKALSMAGVLVFFAIAVAMMITSFF
jgi:serine protease AprX